MHQAIYIMLINWEKQQFYHEHTYYPTTFSEASMHDIFGTKDKWKVTPFSLYDSVYSMHTNKSYLSLSFICTYTWNNTVTLLHAILRSTPMFKIGRESCIYKFIDYDAMLIVHSLTCQLKARNICAEPRTVISTWIELHVCQTMCITCFSSSHI